MIALPSGARVWLAAGHTDIRKGFQSLALLVRETLKRDPNGGHLFVFRGRRGDLIKCLWHDGQGQYLFSKRLERGHFLWRSPGRRRCNDQHRAIGATLDDVKPPVLRRIEVPFDIRLDRLHLAIQAAMGWTNSHLYELLAGDVGWGVPDPGWSDGPRDARKARLNDVLLEDVGTKTLRYIYDFGDGWAHTIKIERLVDPRPGVAYPVLIDALGCCPPEDIGGP
jgi:hypothetical protein